LQFVGNLKPQRKKMNKSADLARVPPLRDDVLKTDFRRLFAESIGRLRAKKSDRRMVDER
jgi:hypothetical protein